MKRRKQTKQEKKLSNVLTGIFNGLEIEMDKEYITVSKGGVSKLEKRKV